MTYPRDLIGYNNALQKFSWKNNAKIAVQFVLNYEEGGEMSVLHGDAHSEVFLSEIIGAQPFYEARHMSIESIYEYGSRAGAWRILDLFRSYGMPLTVFAVAMAAERHPQIIEQALKDGHEIASHGYRWINYHGMSKEQESEHMHKAMEILTSLTGERPYGWYTGRTSEQTRDLVHEYGGFLYDADDYSDDLPFWSNMVKGEHLIVPYTLDTNDMRFATPQGFHNSEQFFTYLKDAFDTLYAESVPKMLSVGLHCRLIGRPARIVALRKFLDYIQSKEDVWIARRVDIARHFRKLIPYDSL